VATTLILDDLEFATYDATDSGQIASPIKYSHWPPNIPLWSLHARAVGSSAIFIPPG